MVCPQEKLRLLWTRCTFTFCVLIEYRLPMAKLPRVLLLSHDLHNQNCGGHALGFILKAYKLPRNLWQSWNHFHRTQQRILGIGGENQESAEHKRSGNHPTRNRDPWCFNPSPVPSGDKGIHRRCGRRVQLSHAANCRSFRNHCFNAHFVAPRECLYPMSNAGTRYSVCHGRGPASFCDDGKERLSQLG